jgi:hypothetical protein
MLANFAFAVGLYKQKNVDKSNKINKIFGRMIFFS